MKKLKQTHASVRQQAQEGNYWDTFVSTSFDYDKRNQKFQTDDGFRSIFTLDIPLVSDTILLIVIVFRNMLLCMKIMFLMHLLFRKCKFFNRR